MSNLLPPSAFVVPAEIAAIKPEKTHFTQTDELQRSDNSTQTLSCFVKEISALESFLSSVISDEKFFPPREVPPEFDGVWSGVLKLGSLVNEKTETIQKLTAAVHRAVPETLETQRILEKLHTDNSNLQTEIGEYQETIQLLEKRLECQGKVMSIQEKTLTTNGSYQKMLEVWRAKVLEMLVQQKMQEMTEDRTALRLQSNIDKLEKQISEQCNEIDILTNKNIDLKANLRLKDKHIHSLTAELSSAKQFEQKHENLCVQIANTYSSLSQAADFKEITLPDGAEISETLGRYEDQICRISQKVELLQSVYREKEDFYSNKLEGLLEEHTSGVPKLSVTQQTELEWSDIEAKFQSFSSRSEEQDARIGALLVEKGIATSQLAEAIASKAHLTQQVEEERGKLSRVSSLQDEQMISLQKRESKAAMHAKHLQRQVSKLTDELSDLEAQFRLRFEEETAKFHAESTKLQNENRTLRRALKHT